MVEWNLKEELEFIIEFYRLVIFYRKKKSKLDNIKIFKMVFGLM